MSGGQEGTVKCVNRGYRRGLVQGTPGVNRLISDQSAGFGDFCSFFLWILFDSKGLQMFCPTLDDGILGCLPLTTNEDAIMIELQALRSCSVGTSGKGTRIVI